MSFYVQNRCSRPKLTPMSISAIFKQKKNFSFSKFFRCLDEKRAAAPPPPPPWLINFDKICSEHVLRIKLKVTKFGHHRIRGFWLAAVTLVIRVSEPHPPSPGLIGLRVFSLLEKILGWENIRDYLGHIITVCQLPPDGLANSLN